MIVDMDRDGRKEIVLECDSGTKHILRYEDGEQIVGEKLKDYGFTYLKTDETCRIFIREVQGIKRYYDPENQVVKQYVTIQESSFSHSF